MDNNKKHYIDLEFVQTLMRSKGIDEKELAKLMGVTLPTIKRFLGGADQSHMSGAINISLQKF